MSKRASVPLSLVHPKNFDSFIGWGRLISKGSTKTSLGSITLILVSNQLENYDL